MTQSPKRLDRREDFLRAHPDRQQEFVVQPQGRIALTEGLGGLPAAQKTDTIMAFLKQTPNFFLEPRFLGGKKTKYQAG